MAKSEQEIDRELARRARELQEALVRVQAARGKLNGKPPVGTKRGPGRPRRETPVA